MPSRKPSINWTEAIWVLGMGAQGGLMIALPVLAGLALGFLLDNRFDTLPLISLILTAIGGIVGPIILYRWVVSTVKQRMESKQDEEKPE
ncbi:MAG: hypothetical protein DRJ03_12935 [Chloroflexi bacterium]|nr:MAG: hypothetical protein DRJ03_12935 [Chloroflexota bacterium]